MFIDSYLSWEYMVKQSYADFPLLLSCLLIHTSFYIQGYCHLYGSVSGCILTGNFNKDIKGTSRLT